MVFVFGSGVVVVGLNVECDKCGKSGLQVTASRWENLCDDLNNSAPWKGLGFYQR